MPTPHLSDVQASSWGSYQRMRVRLAGRLNREMSQETGLSEADFEVLYTLSESPDESEGSDHSEWSDPI